MGTFYNEETGEISSSHILVDREEILDDKGQIKIEVIPTSAMGTKITVSTIPPENPQVNDLWIDTSV
jgi:hypothetical protein